MNNNMNNNNLNNNNWNTERQNSLNRLVSTDYLFSSSQNTLFLICIMTKKKLIWVQLFFLVLKVFKLSLEDLAMCVFFPTTDAK